MKTSWGAVCQADTLANRPIAPDVPAGFGSLYYATDTAAIYAWNPNHAGAAAWELLMQFKPVTVAALPTANLIAGSEAVVSDATTPALGATVAGAGAVQVAVIWNGAAWKVS